MKIRQGFVSNSSSSSFIVAFPKDMDMTIESIKAYLFDGIKLLSHFEGVISSDQAAEAIVDALADQKPNDRMRLYEACSGWIEGSPNYDDFLIPEEGKDSYQLKCDWDAYESALDRFQSNFLDAFMHKALQKNMDVYSFKFSDNDSEFGCVMEHGDIFKNTMHEQISRH